MEEEICGILLSQSKNAVYPPVCTSGKSEYDKKALMLDTIPVRFGDRSALAGDHVDDPDALARMVQAFANPAQENQEHQRILVTRRHG